MTFDEIAAQYSVAFALWFRKHVNRDPDREYQLECVINDLWEAWMSGHSSHER
jgi:hypothetical protein